MDPIVQKELIDFFGKDLPKQIKHENTYLDIVNIQSKENAIRNNNFVPKVPKLAKSASEVDTKKVKPNLVTSPSTVVESKKKFIFTKRQIKLRNPNLL